ncbi:hypothetical protein [Nonomuraea sp. GTA35]|uniref:hypothetical protein n=1 Tax=Nonomuraea sp. GTA35 TaxID=1676746 RepID=UPI0035BF5EB3
MKPDALAETIARSMIDAQATADVPHALHAHQYARRIASDLRTAGMVARRLATATTLATADEPASHRASSPSPLRGGLAVPFVGVALTQARTGATDSPT